MIGIIMHKGGIFRGSRRQRGEKHKGGVFRGCRRQRGGIFPLLPLAFAALPALKAAGAAGHHVVDAIARRSRGGGKRMTVGKVKLKIIGQLKQM